MAKKLLIVGGGFAGVWGALGAARVLHNAGRNGDAEVTLISPNPDLHIRPRLHESGPDQMRAPLAPLMHAVGVKFIQGTVEKIHTGEQRVGATTTDGREVSLAYDRLLLTSGSKLYRPPVPGIAEHAFAVDQLKDAVALEDHLASLAALPGSPARRTFVIVGGGFTGIEVATELPPRLRKLLGPDADFQIIIVDRNAELAFELGANPRPLIREALDALGIKYLLGSGVVSVDADGVRTASGQYIEAKTVIWTGGMRASSLTEQVSSKLDPLGRLEVTPDLRVVGAPNVFAAGDVARAITDEDGHYALMSCQHAIFMGRFGGNNAAADLLGMATLPYKQPFYATCLDLGAWGAVYTEGWDRQVKLTRTEGKDRKRLINTQWIYPPPANREDALAAGNPQISFG